MFQFDAGSSSITIDCGAAVAINYFAIAAHELFTSNTDNIVLKASSVSNFATSVTLATINNVRVVVFMTALMLITLILQYQTKLLMMTTLRHSN